MSDNAAALGWSLNFLIRALDGLAQILGDVPARYIDRAVWRRANRQLRMLEMLARRWLVCMAGAMAMTNAPKRRAHQQPRQPDTRPRANSFALFDPLARPHFDTAPDSFPALIANAQPRSAAPLIARLSALRALATNPQPAISRMSRWLARPRQGRRTPIRLGPLPGMSHRASLLDLAVSTVLDLHQRAVNVLNHPPPPA